MFKIGDYAVCPGHGVGQVCDIEQYEVNKQKKNVYLIKIIDTCLTVTAQTGIRKLVTHNEIDEVFALLKDHDVKIDNSTWNRRYREYMNKIKVSNLLEIATVLRELSLLKRTKNLSFGEKKMLDQCKDLLAQEICIVIGHRLIHDTIIEIEKCFN